MAKDRKEIMERKEINLLEIARYINIQAMPRELELIKELVINNIEAHEIMLKILDEERENKDLKC